MATAKKTASKKNTTKKRAVKKSPAKETTKKVSAKKATALVEQNGVKQPKEGTKTRAVWDIADKLSAKSKVPAVRADVLKQAKEDGLNAATASTQYQLWRRFHGLGKAVINEQPPEPRVIKASITMVHSVFYTIQGEGPFAGRPAVFIRLWGCNLQCPWCDTDYTSTRRDVTVLELVADVDLLYGAKWCHSPLVVITGGEPLRQPIGMLMTELVDQGYTVQVETNGTLPPAPTPEHVQSGIHYVVSPKTGTVHPKMAARALAYKYVMDADQYDERTGLPLKALDHPVHYKLPKPPSHISKRMTFIQPMDPDPDGRHLHACLNSVMDHGNTLCLQTHKIVNLP